MADVLIHVLAGFVIGTLLSIRYNWLGPAHVTLVMIGALATCFVKIQLLIPDAMVTSLLGGATFRSSSAGCCLPTSIERKPSPCSP